MHLETLKHTFKHNDQEEIIVETKYIQKLIITKILPIKLTR